jgi:molybdopterin-containing oxidoreductase family membrane subunit
LIALASLFMVAALWVKRYLIIVPTLESPLIPMQDTRLEYVKYSPTWVEWALTFAGIATFFLFFTLLSKFMTIIPISEFGDKEKAEEKIIKPEGEIVPA